MGNTLDLKEKIMSQLSPQDVPDLISLQCFIALTKSLNFKEAATVMSLSPTAFSDRIRKLEDQLGIQLFERTTRKVMLTPIGSRLISHTNELLQSTSRWVEATKKEGVQSPYNIRLGTRFELGMSWLLPSLPQLTKQQVTRSFSLKWGTDTELLRMLYEGSIDALISSVRVQDPTLNILPLHREDYVLVAAKECALDYLHFDQTKHLTLIDTEDTLPLFRYYSESLADGRPWQFKSIELMGTIAAVRARVLLGIGVAVLPLYFVHQDLEKGTLVNLDPTHTLHHDFFRLIWREELIHKTALIELAEELTSIPLS